MGLADALIFAIAAVVDVAVLAWLRWLRRRRKPMERITRSLVLVVRHQRV